MGFKLQSIFSLCTGYKGTAKMFSGSVFWTFVLIYLSLNGASAGVLESEGYGDKVYPNNFEKIYKISVSEGKIMEIRFTDFDVEWWGWKWSGWDKCYDFVMVHDGEDDNGDGVGADIILPKTCGHDVPAPFKSKSNKVQVHFKTDESFHYKG